MAKIIESYNNDAYHNYNHHCNIYVLSYYHGYRDDDEYIYDSYSDGELMNVSFIMKRFYKQLVHVKSTLNQNKYNGNSAAT